jgi:peptidoglycan/LPS O-acetylase OafA/YrhL
VPQVGRNHTVHLGLLRFGLEVCGGLALGRLATEGRLPPGLVLAVGLALPVGLALGRDALTVAGLAALMLGIWQHAAWQAEPARPDLLLRLGDASFGVYLCWVFIEAALVGLLRQIDPGLAGRILLMAGGFLANLLAGWLACRFVETPAHRWILQRAAPAPGGRLARGVAEQRRDQPSAARNSG